MENKKVPRQQFRTTSAQRLQMVVQFRHSGLSRVEFAQQHGIPISTLSWWLRKAKRVSSLPAPILFSEVMVTPPAAKPNSTWAMEVVAPSGLTIRCREAISAGDLVQLLKGERC